MIVIEKNIDENILKKRAIIYDHIKSLIERDFEFLSINVNHMAIIFNMYDDLFFDNQINKYVKDKIKFSISGRMTKSAGKTIVYRNYRLYEIRLGADFFSKFNYIDKIKRVGGVEVKDFLEAILVVFEHEICHVIEFLAFGKSSCRNKQFKTMANDLFGHTESCHQLPTNRELAKHIYNYNIGDTITFNYKGSEKIGIIYNINKRATILVEHKKGKYKDRMGTRYEKFYVPIDKMQAVK